MSSPENSKLNSKRNSVISTLAVESEPPLKNETIRQSVNLNKEMKTEEVI